MGTASLNINGNEISVSRGWSISQSATSVDIGNQDASVGSSSFSVIDGGSARFLLDKNAVLSTDVGQMSGLITEVNGVGGTSVSISLDPVLSKLTAEVLAPVMGETQASEIMQAYLDLVGGESVVTLDWMADANPVMSVRAWRGELWTHLRWMAAACKVFITVQGSRLIVRDLATAPVLDITDGGGIRIFESSRDAARSVNVWYDNPEFVQDIGVTAHNFVTNPSFEASTSGWSAALVTGNSFSSAPSRTSVTSVYGTYSYGMSVAPRPGSISGGGKADSAVRIQSDQMAIPIASVPVGSLLYARGFARLSGGNSAVAGRYFLRTQACRIEIEWLSDTGAVISSNSSAWVANSFTNADSHAVSAVRPDGATGARIVFHGRRTDQSRPAQTWLPHNYYFDGMILSESAISPTGYFDGSIPGSTWDGTPNASVSSRLVTDSPEIYNALRDGGSVFTVTAGEVVSDEIDTNVYATSIRNPSPTDAATPGIGQYAITGDEIRVPAVQWTAYGGKVEAVVGEEPGVIKIIVTGPEIDIPGFPGPYSLAYGTGSGEVPALSIIGSGVFTSPEVVEILTSADPSQVAELRSPEIRTPFIATMGDAYDIGIWPATLAAGQGMSLEFSLALSTSMQLGLVEGSLVTHADSVWRVTNATVRRSGVSFKAEWYTTMEDFDNPWIGRSVDEFDNLWNGYTAGDVQIAPLRQG